MTGHTYFGKQKLCYTEVSDFTDFQGIGRDPIYRRYDSVFSVIRRVVPTNLQHFLATPEYLINEDQICWHVDKWIEHPTRLTDLSGEEHDKYKSILEDTVRKYKSCVQDLNGEDLQIMAGAIKYIDDDRVYCSDDKVYLVAWGMTPDTKQHKVIGSVIHDFAFVKKYKITFDAGKNGTLDSKLDKNMSRAEGTTLSQIDLPLIVPSVGWLFDGWSPSPIGQLVTGDLQYTATYIKEEKIVPPPEVPTIPLPEVPPFITPNEPEEYFTCRFDAGENGIIDGTLSVRKLANTSLHYGEVPEVKPNKGYKCKGWNIDPLNSPITTNMVFTAVYEEVVPWYRRWWLGLTGFLASLFTGKGCLKWLLWIFLAILLFFFLSWLLRGCVGLGHKPINGIIPVDSITRSDGRVVEDNGFSHPITGNDGVLPDAGGIVAPVLGKGGADIPIISQPGVPNTIANRLFLFMEDESGNVESLAKDFKKAYSGNQYSIIGYDKEVKLLVIQIPENERDKIRQDINGQIPNHKFIVFDEEIYELNGQVKTQSSNPGWHLKAINLQAGWAITKGSSSVKIAVVDDGIDPSHPMFKGRIVEAYNVFTQNNKLSLGEGHGTHTAGLAAGSAEYFSKGASGVAPGCMLMPIQVFDNKHCSLSSIVSGVMYAVHHDADVVNISIGPSFKGLNLLPVEQQDQIARQQFKNVEKLWARVCTLAAKKNCILVFAAGNDDILSSVPPENRNQSSIVVTAVDKNLYPTDFTNYGPCSDISAPGKEIYSSFPRGGFQSCDGTSMAAPIVAGTIALMKSLKKDLTVLQARNVLYKTGADVSGSIPPMVLVDKALAGVQRGDFSTPSKRQIRPVPDGNGDDSAAGKALPVQEVDTPINQVPPQQSNETDYDAIRRQIDEYKNKISELEKLLPNKK